MNTNSRRKHPPARSIDGLLQDSYLLVVAMRAGKTPQSGKALWMHCSAQIEAVRQALKADGMSPRSIDYISYAQCALLDETVLGYARDEAHADWASEPLQAKFFNRHQAGRFLYEDMQEVLRDPTSDPEVLTVYHRVLLLGFKGRYSNLQDPEREGLIRALEERILPLVMRDAVVSDFARVRGPATWRWLRSPVLQLLAAALLVAVVWLGLDHLLRRLVASLLPGAL